MKHKSLILIVAFLLCLPLITAHAATTVSLVPQKTDWVLGEQVVIDVVMNEPTAPADGPGIWAQSADFFYTPTQLDYASFSLSSKIVTYSLLTFDPTVSTGSIVGEGSWTAPTVSYDSLFDPVSHNLTIGTLYFDTIYVGDDILITVDASSAHGSFGFYDAGGGFTPDFVDASINVSAVPIPSTILLLGGGLVALVGLRRRRS